MNENKGLEHIPHFKWSQVHSPVNFNFVLLQKHNYWDLSIVSQMKTQLSGNLYFPQTLAPFHNLHPPPPTLVLSMHNTVVFTLCPCIIQNKLIPKHCMQLLHNDSTEKFEGGLGGRVISNLLCWVMVTTSLLQPGPLIF